MITSSTNPLVKDLVRFRSRRYRQALGRFIIEGKRPLVMAAGAGVEIVHQIISPDLGGEPILAGIPTTEMTAEPFRKASIRQNPDGVMAVASQLDTRLERLHPSEGCLLLVVESVEKPGNLGAMLRTADALGVEAVVVADPTTDIHNPNVVRASQGALFTVPVGVAATNEVVTWLGLSGITLVATTPTASRSLWDVDLGGSVAIAIGAESTGLSTALVAAASENVTIPMAGHVDSLNASVTAAIVVYEAVRQRQA